MAKKKSKTQKNKQNIKKKTKTIKAVSTENKNSTIKTSIKEEKPVVQDKKVSKRIVDKNKVKYNVLFTEETLKKVNKKKKTKKELTKLEIFKEKISTIISNVKKYINIIVNFIIKYFNVSISFIKKHFNLIKDKINKKKLIKKASKPKKKAVTKKKTIQKEEPPKNIIKRFFYILKNNLHIAFNTLLIVTFTLLLTGLIRTKVFTTGSIIYISCIAIFLMIVAMSYTKYLSGKIYSLFIVLCMFVGINYLQYTYDFINNLNTNQYEYKEYYVVTFNNGRNKSIYNINNKKVGLLKDNSTNIKRILNIKLDSIKYIEYENQNDFYEDFYNQEYRAIIVNNNQYKYLTNNISDNSRSVKILYKFQVNAKK